MICIQNCRTWHRNRKINDLRFVRIQPLRTKSVCLKKYHYYPNSCLSITWLRCHSQCYYGIATFTWQVPFLCNARMTKDPNLHTIHHQITIEAIPQRLCGKRYNPNPRKFDETEWLDSSRDEVMSSSVFGSRIRSVLQLRLLSIKWAPGLRKRYDRTLE
jgi:hypothetical protein